MALSWVHASWFVTVVCSLIVAVVRCNENVDMIDIKPGSGLQNFDIKLGDAVCRFHCKAQGGTNEQWKFTILGDDSSNGFMCSVERESGVSYLFFEEFKMEFPDQYVGQEFHVFGEGRSPLNPDEYVTSYREAAVNSNPGAFQSKLSKVVLIVSRQEGEL